MKFMEVDTCSALLILERPIICCRCFWCTFDSTVVSSSTSTTTKNETRTRRLLQGLRAPDKFQLSMDLLLWTEPKLTARVSFDVNVRFSLQVMYSRNSSR